MRKILTLLMLTVLISCKTEIKKKDFKLIGEWGIYIFYRNDITVSCNACPKILFKDSNVAELILPSGKTEHYKWNSSGRLLKLKFQGNENINTYFSNSEYGLEFNKKDNFTELTLLLNEKEQFLLRK
ncbi:hypothetical protein [uncultured Tenacibaculum sp.]|uniref:hypothetical protein n=1 Tax=uncultured Tenacibaculum sp. TaxID=174713 RepID=UPI00260814D4|nr:hypothetical protein [uncultured Tenacibaculum sp.]